MKITSNGVYSLKPTQDFVSDKTAVYVSGSLGGGKVVVGYKDDFDTFIPLTGGELASGQHTVFLQGHGVELFATVSGATSPSISIRAAGVQ